MDEGIYRTLHEAQQTHWWYAARRTILGEVIELEKQRGLPPGKLYDLGCGVGSNLSVLERFGETVGVDTSPDAVDFARSRGHQNVRQADLNALEGLEPASGSVAVLADVIEHLEDEAPCLEAAERLLAPNGALIVTVPAYMFLWGPTDVLGHHFRRYVESSLRKVIGRRFDVRHSTYFNSLLFPPMVVQRFVERALDRPGDDGAAVPVAPVNDALKAIFSAEAKVIPRHHLPFGGSILCVARKR